MRGFSLLALVIGIFGVFNNLIISFLERQRSIAMLRSIGMSKRQSIKMFFIEALTGGLDRGDHRRFVWVCLDFDFADDLKGSRG